MLNHYGNHFTDSSKNKQRIAIPQDPAIPLLGIFLKELKAAYHSDPRIAMFTAAQCIADKPGGYSSTDE